MNGLHVVGVFGRVDGDGRSEGLMSPECLWVQCQLVIVIQQIGPDLQNTSSDNYDWNALHKGQLFDLIWLTAYSKTKLFKIQISTDAEVDCYNIPLVIRILGIYTALGIVYIASVILASLFYAKY